MAQLQTIRSKLRALIRRRRRIRVASGVLSTLAVAGGGILAIVLLDSSIVLFSQHLRLTLSAIVYAASLATAYFQILRPLRRNLDITQMARSIEASNPDLEERLSSSVELLGTGRPTRQGSPALLARLADEASLEAASLEPRREFPWRRVGVPALASFSIAALIGTAWRIWPEHTEISLARVLYPFQQVGNAHSPSLAVTPGDVRLAVGEALEISVEIDQQDAAWVRRRLGNGGDAVERMRLVAPRGDNVEPRFVLSIPSVSESFAYRVHSGKALSRYYRVEVVDRPQVLDVQVSYQFPAYTRLEPRTESPRDGLIAAAAGSTVRLSATLNRPVKTATLLLDGTPIWSNEETRNDSGSPVLAWEFPLVEGLDGKWSIELQDSRGVGNQPQAAPVRAIADAAPEVWISSPTELELAVGPGEILPIEFLAAEDYGFLESQMLVSIAGSQLPPIATPLPRPLDNEPGRWGATASLDLRRFDLTAVEALEVRIRLADNRPDNSDRGGEAISAPLTLRIDPDARSLLEQSLALRGEQLHTMLSGILVALEAARDRASDKPQALLDSAWPDAGLAREMEEIGRLAGEVESKLYDAHGEVVNSPFAQLAPRIDALASDVIDPARGAAEAVALAEREIGRVHQARNAARGLEEGAAELGDITRALNRAVEQARVTAEFGHLVERKEQLAERLRAAGPSQRSELEAQLNDLQSLADDLAARSAAPISSALSDASGFASALARGAAELATDQESLAGLLSLAADLASREELVGEFVGHLEAESRSVAGALAELAEQATGSEIGAAIARESGTAAAVAEQLKQQDLAGAATLAADSADRLAAIHAGGLPAGSVAGLAKRQKAVAAWLEKLGGGDLESALSGMQVDLAQLAKDLSEKGAALEANARSIADSTSSEQIRNAVRQLAAAADDAAGSTGTDAGAGSAAAAEKLNLASDEFSRAASRLAALAETPASQQKGVGLAPEGAKEQVAELAAGLTRRPPSRSTNSADWVRPSGSLQTELSTRDVEKAPASYRPLVQRYFEEIARRSRETETAQP